MEIENPVPQQKGKWFTNTRRFRSGLEHARNIFSGNVETVGEESFNLVPPNKDLLIATSHMTIFDIPFIASKVPKRFRVGLPNVSVQWSFFGDPAINTLMALAGKKNFFRIDYPGYKRSTSMLPPSRLNKDNFDNMLAEMKKGMTPVMSLYNPTNDGLLPTEPGIGAVLLAQQADALVIPAAAVFDTDDLRIGQSGVINFIRTARAHPNVKISFGEPISLSKIDTSPLFEYLEKREQKGRGVVKGDPASAEKDFKDAKEVYVQLEEQARQIAEKIREMVPEKKYAAAKSS